MGYLAPNAPVSDTWQGHLNRNPPSSEPGTDYATAYGTPLAASETGTITDTKGSNSNATGRYITLRLDDGRTLRYLHLSGIVVSTGQRVGRGQTIGYTGASANGSDWGVGAHVHITLWPGDIWAAPTIDFERYVEEEDMSPEQAQQLAEIENAVGWIKDRIGGSAVSGDPTLAQDINNVEGIASWIKDRVAGSVQNDEPSVTALLEDIERQTTDASAQGAHSLTAPAWLLGALLGLIALVEVARLVLVLADGG